MMHGQKNIKYFSFVSARCCRAVAWSYAKCTLVLCRLWGGGPYCFECVP